MSASPLAVRVPRKELVEGAGGDDGPPDAAVWAELVALAQGSPAPAGAALVRRQFSEASTGADHREVLVDLTFEIGRGAARSWNMQIPAAALPSLAEGISLLNRKARALHLAPPP